MADRFASLTLTRKRLQQRIKAVQDMRPVMARLAPEVEAMSRRAIDQSRSPRGQQFARLAASTLKRRRPGEGSTPLKKTGRSYGQIRCVPSQRNGLVLFAPQSLRWHMTRGPNRPKRNAFPFEIGPDGKPHPIPKLDRMIRNAMRLYLLELRAPNELPIAAE